MSYESRFDDKNLINGGDPKKTGVRLEKVSKINNQEGSLLGT